MTDQLRTPRRVLVVEDEPDFAALMESTLRGLSYDVGVAYDGDEALAQTETLPPDVITLDIQMPRKSGVTFYRELKRRKALRDIPVIVVTGLRCEDPDWNGIIHSFLETEDLPRPHAYLDKPIDREILAKSIEEALAPRTRMS